MDNTNKELRTEVGKFIRYKEGYYTFEMDEDVIIFEGISREAANKYDLQDFKFIDANFEITYSESLGDLDDEDFMVFHIEDLKLIE